MTDDVLHLLDPALFDALRGPSGDVVLVSPFISYPVAHRLAGLASKATVPWRLVTRLDPVNAARGVLHPGGLRELFDAGVTISDVAGLHAKAYLIGQDFGLLGSANLTDRGLGGALHPNAELSVQLSPDQVAAVRSMVASWPAKPVSAADLDKLKTDADAIAKVLPHEHAPAPTNLTIDQLLLDARDPARTLWVKAEYGEAKLAQWRDSFFFASPSPTKRPSFKPGDLVLIYALGDKSCYAAVEVTSEPFIDPEVLLADDFSPEQIARWPWVTRTRPRLVPDEVVKILPAEIGVKGLRNGHARVDLTGFSAAVHRLAEGVAGVEGD